MEIRFLGHSSFLIKSKQAKIVCDPFTSNHPTLGLKFPKGIVADVVTISHDHFDHNGVLSIDGSPYIINEPGEFEIKGVNFYGIQSYHDENQGEERGVNTIFLIETEGISICHLGDLGHKLSSGQVSELNEVDILMVPVGGTYTIDAKKAVEVVNQIEPKIVIPMHYLDPDSKLQLDKIDTFLHELGQENVEKQDKLVIKEKDLIQEEMQVVVLHKK